MRVNAGLLNAFIDDVTVFADDRLVFCLKGGEVAITTASATAITADEIINLSESSLPARYGITVSEFTGEYSYDTLR